MTTYTLIWQPAAIAGLIRIRSADPKTAKAIRAAISALAREPRAPGSTPLGNAGLRRLRLEDVRVLYEVDDAHQAIHLLTIGQIRR